MGEAQFGFCLNTSTIRCGELSLEEKLAVTAEAGYDGIEPWVSELDEFAAGGGDLADLRKRTRDSGLEIVNLIGFFNWATENDADRTEGIAEARRAFAMAQTVGCKFVAAPPWGLTDVTGMDLFGIAKRYGELIDIGAEYGVMPLLEYWGHSKTLGKLGEAAPPGFVLHGRAVDAGGAVLRLVVPVEHLPDAAKIRRFAMRVQQRAESGIGQIGPTDNGQRFFAALGDGLHPAGFAGGVVGRPAALDIDRAAKA